MDWFLYDNGLLTTSPNIKKCRYADINSPDTSSTLMTCNNHEPLTPILKKNTGIAMTNDFPDEKRVASSGKCQVLNEMKRLIMWIQLQS